QLNPHFLFNTLNAISTLVLDKDSNAASGMLNRLSKFLRYTLVHQSTQKMTVEKEVEALKLYLDIEKVRFEDRLTIIWNIDEAAKNALIPSLLLQPIIENAIKHAISKKEDGGVIEISAFAAGEEKQDKLVLRVCDDGEGLYGDEVDTDEQSTGVGLKNTQERLEQLYGDGFVFNLADNKPSGLAVTIKMPLEFTSAE
ncbi:MAG: histidine kinase, partial [Sphingomonadales bacterium]|nr:histidine kinase [Sphingomonadales bacterium]